MSASEYLPLYQSFTNRTHIRKGRRFDQSEISQIVEKNICCSVILSRNVCWYVNLPITYILVTVCPADGITSCCPIWVDTIKKWISIKIWRVFVQYKDVYVVDTVEWMNFKLPKKGILKLITPESESNRSAYGFRPRPPSWRSSSMGQDKLYFVDRIAICAPYQTVHTYQDAKTPHCST